MVPLNDPLALSVVSELFALTCKGSSISSGDETDDAVGGDSTEVTKVLPLISIAFEITICVHKF